MRTNGVARARGANLMSSRRRATHSVRRRDADNALHVVADLASWVHNADTKAGLLAGVQTALLAGYAARGGSIRSGWTHGGLGGWFETAVSVVLLVTILVAIEELFRSQVPRIVRLDNNVFSFLRASLEPGELTAERVERDAWAYAEQLGRIARAKFRHVRNATIATWLAASAITIWLVLAG